jgi:glycosyltransferase involved in cell wall biosynthesis
MGMNVVMIGPFGLRPRATMAVRALPMAHALAARDHNVAVLLPPWQNPEDAGQCWEEDGVTVENIDLPPGLPGLFHLLTAMRLVQRALSLHPDVIHCFKPKAYSGLAHWLLARFPRTHRPHLVVDTDDWEGPGGWNDLAPYTPAQRHFFTWQERWGLTHADAITVASRTLQGLVWAVGVNPAQVYYVPNGIAGQEHGSPFMHHASRTQPPTILLYTRFFEFPVSRVIEVLQRVGERVPEVRLLVIGKGLFDEEKRLLDMARQAGLSGAVEYVGWVEPDALPGYLAQATLAIYPFDDTLINRTKCAVKLLELLAAGVPVVAEAVGQNREMIRHGETGWLVSSGDTASFAEAVLELLDDASLRQRLGQTAAHDVRARFGWGQLVETVEQAYGIRQ